jgi:orotidine-5'-phosphate decarboxylase
MESFAERLIRAVRTKKSPVLLGLDPRADMIPDDCFPNGKKDASAIAEGFFVFGARLLEALKDDIAAVKPQIAFYEALGLPGLKAYVDLLRKAESLGILTIADIKRGDIGSTSEAYAQAHLGGVSGPGPFEADAVTINPWLGGDSLEPYFERCRDRGKGVYLLLHTSNPGSIDLQEQTLASGQKLYQSLADLVARWQDEWTVGEGYSSIGVVVGATWPEQLLELRERCPRAPFLVPGYGSQGGTGLDVAPLFAQGPCPHLINASRSLTYAYLKRGGSLEEAAIAAAREMKADILQGQRW